MKEEGNRKAKEIDMEIYLIFDFILLGDLFANVDDDDGILFSPVNCDFSTVY